MSHARVAEEAGAAGVGWWLRRTVKQTKHLAGKHGDTLTAKRLLAQMVSWPPHKLFRRSSSMQRLGLVPTDSIERTELELASPLHNKFGAMVRTNSVRAPHEVLHAQGAGAGRQAMQARGLLPLHHRKTAPGRRCVCVCVCVCV